jgi:AcrR family transcriptional regulator
MSQPPDHGRPVNGLRERKKAKTKAALQRHAVRLFLEQGYDATTVEQVAEAAEVSTSTVFRYFPTKEDLVISDDYDPFLIAVFQAQPAGMGVIEALRRAMRETFSELSDAELVMNRERAMLTLSVPALWGANLDNLQELTVTLRELIGKRAGRGADDPAVLALAGATFGIMLDVMFRWARDPEMDVFADVDAMLARLEAGLSL